MARQALTTAWTELGTTKTGTYIQNVGDDLLLVAFAGSSPAVGVVTGFVLQRGDFAPVISLPSTNIYARALSAATECEFETTA